MFCSVLLFLNRSLPFLVFIIAQSVVYGDGELFLDSCDFRGCSATVLVEGVEGAVFVRNAVLGDNNCECVRCLCWKRRRPGMLICFNVHAFWDDFLAFPVLLERCCTHSRVITEKSGASAMRVGGIKLDRDVPSGIFPPNLAIPLVA